MVAGHIQEKKGYYYVVIGYKTSAGKYKRVWYPTNLPVKGNKRKAEKVCAELRVKFVPPEEAGEEGEFHRDMLFADFIELWLNVARTSVSPVTFCSYEQQVRGKIAPYFREKMVKLCGSERSPLIVGTVFAPCALFFDGRASTPPANSFRLVERLFAENAGFS